MKINYNDFFNFIKMKNNIKTDRDLAKYCNLSYSFLSELRNNKKDLTLKKFIPIIIKLKNQNYNELINEILTD